MKIRTSPYRAVQAYAFPFSSKGQPGFGLEKETPRSIELEAWDVSMIFRGAPIMGFQNCNQLDTFYNALNSTDQDLLNFCCGGNFLDKCLEECLKISRAKVLRTHSVSKTNFARYVKAMMRLCEEYAKTKSMFCKPKVKLQAQLTLATSNQRLESMLGNFIKMNTASTSGSGTLPGNTVTNPKEDLKVWGTKDRCSANNGEALMTSNPPVVQIQTRNPILSPNVAPIDISS
ncbi:hypothetical protein Tco_0415079 [Tanacetum coccineum]